MKSVGALAEEKRDYHQSDQVSMSLNFFARQWRGEKMLERFYLAIFKTTLIFVVKSGTSLLRALLANYWTRLKKLPLTNF